MPAEIPRKTSKEKAENFPLKVLDPISLMKDNAAFSSLDPEALAGKFTPGLYKPIDFVRVQYGPGDVQDRIRDGHNRTAGAAEYKKTPEGKNFEFKGQDITRHILDEKYGGEGENLTPVQYLESIGGPTKKEFVEVRMAGHIMTEWDGIVGKDAAKELPALTALSILSFSPLGFESPKMVEKKISSYDKIVANETPEKRAELESGIVKIAGVIRNVQRVYDDITQAAFTLAGNELSPEKLKEQAQGFLSLPEVDAKINDGADPEKIAQRKKLLEASIISAIKEKGEIRDRRAFYQLLTDATLSFGMTNSLLQPSDKKLMIRYNEAKDAQNGGKEKPKRVSSALKKDKPPETEPKTATVEKIVYEEKPFDFSKNLAPIPYIAALRNVTSPVDEETLARMMAVQGEIARIRDLSNRGKKKRVLASPPTTRTQASILEEKVGKLPTKEETTQNIESFAKRFFPSLENEWPKINACMRKSDPMGGKDTTGQKAVEDALSSRLINVMTRLQLKPNSEEVKYLSANHYLLGLRGAQATERSNTKIDQYESDMHAALNAYLRTKTHQEKTYLTLLQFSVYGPIGNPNMTHVLNILQAHKKKKQTLDEGMASYKKYLQESQLNDIQDIFNFRILGLRDKE